MIEVEEKKKTCRDDEKHWQWRAKHETKREREKNVEKRRKHMEDACDCILR